MEAKKPLNQNLFNNVLVFLLSVFLLLFAAYKGFTQETATKEEPTSAIKALFKELKSEESSSGTFIMIGVIVVIVGLAMYMSFKGGDTTTKTRFKVKVKNQ